MLVTVVERGFKALIGSVGGHFGFGAAELMGMTLGQLEYWHECKLEFLKAISVNKG